MKDNKSLKAKDIFDTIIENLKPQKKANNKLNISFLRHLIDFDFILNIDNFKANNFKKQEPLNATYIVDLVTEFKIMIRMLQFLSDDQKKKLNKFFYFVIESELHIEIFESCLKCLKNPSTRNIFATKTESFWDSDFESQLVFRKRRHINSLYLFDDPKNKSLKPVINEVNLMRRYVKNKSFLITKMNSTVEKKDYGTYKVLNNMSDFKKIIFIACILNKIFDTQKPTQL